MMSLESKLEDFEEFFSENELLATSEENDEKDFLYDHLLDYSDDDVESLSGSVLSLLESESLGSLKKLLEPSTPVKITNTKECSDTPPNNSIINEKKKRKRTIKLVRKRDPLISDGVETVQESSTKSSNTQCDSSPDTCITEKCVKRDELFLIDKEPDRSIDDVSDLRDYLNQKKRKILSSEVHSSKSSQQQAYKSGSCSPTLFPALPRGIILDHKVVNNCSDSQQSLHYHLFQKQSSWQFSLEHL